MPAVPSRGRAASLASGVLALGLVVAGCSGSNVAGGGPTGPAPECGAYTQYGDLNGKTVTVYTSIVEPEDQPHIDSYKPFEQCTGIKIVYEGSRSSRPSSTSGSTAATRPTSRTSPSPACWPRSCGRRAR